MKMGTPTTRTLRNVHADSGFSTLFLFKLRWAFVTEGEQTEKDDTWQCFSTFCAAEPYICATITRRTPPLGPNLIHG